MAGAVAAISAPGRHGDNGMGGSGANGPSMHGDRGRMGRFAEHFRGPMTKSDFDTRTRERFARFDRNSDGVIDISEIEVTFNEFRAAHNRNRPGSQKAGAGLLRQFDLDHDGKVTKAEYLESVKKRFVEFDLNNDGRLTDDDLPPMMRGRNALATLGDRKGGRYSWLKDVTVGADGAITQDAVLAAAEKRFARFDVTKDGVIDTADFDALRKQNLDYRVKRFVHHFGADKDGRITREQFTAKANERFARLDANGDGSISRDERRGHHGWRGEGHDGGSGMQRREHGRAGGGAGGETGPTDGPRRNPDGK
jgi:Ca2+-binding EF-hand superfamily protein